MGLSDTILFRIMTANDKNSIHKSTKINKVRKQNTTEKMNIISQRQKG